MCTFHQTVAALTLASTVASVARAQAASCPSGPGAAFGITGYSCATCAYKQETGERPVYSFFAEPVVMQTAAGSAITAGDVIEAVNGKPITTAAGAEQFTYPPAGPSSITVRRGRDRQVIRVVVSDAFAECYRAPISGRGDGIRIRGATSPAGPKPLIIVDGVVVDGAAAPSSNDGTGRFGFAVACRPSCTAATGRDGVLQYTYYKYDGFPPVVALRAGGPAERAGLETGDLLVKIDGHLVVEEDGAMRLARIDRSESIRLTVRRDGKDLEIVVRASP